MRELKINEIKAVNGGVLPVLIYIAGNYLTIYNMYQAAKRHSE
jgi:uncharacterized membrane protein YkvI